MPEIRISVSEKLEDIVNKISTHLGIKATDYVKNLIISDLKNKGIDTNQK